jgi:chromosome segregation ATPase
VALVVFAVPALAQQQDRERAQLRQMQQQVQKLMQDNAALQRDNSELKEKLAQGEKKSSETARTLAVLQRKSQSEEKDLDTTRTGLHDTQEELVKAKAENERLTTELLKRDEALRVAADTQAQMRKSIDAERLELGHRVTQQNARAELCERKHEQLIALSEEILERYQKARTRIIGEPITQIFSVRAQAQVQELRDRIDELRLDLPPATAESH